MSGRGWCSILGSLGGVVSLALIATSPALAQPATLERAASLFGEGNQLAATGDDAGSSAAFRAALLWYQQATADLEPAVNGQLMYNIGNTHLRLGDIGRAIAAYRRAERVIPGDGNLRQSLEHARSLRQAAVGDDGRGIGAALLAWHHVIPARVRVAVLLVAFNVAFLAGAGLLLLHSRQRESGSSSPLRFALRWTVIAATVLVGAAAASITVGSIDQRQTAGVIVISQVVGRLGDSAAYDPSHSAPLTAGIEFRVIGRRAGWLHIVLPDGSRSWVPESATELL